MIEHKIKKMLKVAVLYSTLAIGFVLNAGEKTSLIPVPKEHAEQQGKAFVLGKETQIFYSEDSAEDTAQLCAEYLRPSTGFALPVVRGNGKGISLSIDNSISAKEGYKLVVNSSGVAITAKTSAGLIYGVQTLRQLLPTKIFATTKQSQVWSLAPVKIVDEPHFSWRGQHLDSCRHFQPIEWVKKFIDNLSLHKLNIMHWHLTEDQGWRIEIKKYPKLTEVGSKRKETLIGHHKVKPKKYDGKEYGGFYTQDEIREVVAYAQRRNVTIVPEIEIPGHSLAALASYPELGCTGGPYEVLTRWGISRDIYCAGNPKVFQFWKDVLDEVLELFPSEYIHTGGDEAPKDRWDECHKCQKLIKEKGLKDSHALQVYVTLEMEKYLASKGRKLIGWDEIFEEGLSTSAIVMWWHKSKDKAILEKGNGLVVATSKSLYFDRAQSEAKTEPLASGGLVSLEKVYHLKPVPDGVTKEQEKNVLGVQGQLWTEFIPNTNHAEYMLYPRQCALAELTWARTDQKDFANFKKRLPKHFERLKNAGVNFRPLD